MSRRDEPFDALRAACDAAGVPPAYRTALFDELRDHVASHAEALRETGVSADDAWRTAVETLGPPGILAAAAVDAGRRWPYRAPWLAVVAAPAMTALVASPAVAVLLLSPLLAGPGSRPEPWVVPLASGAAAAVAATLTAILRDVRRRYAGLTWQAWAGTVLVVLACASFSTALRSRDSAIVLDARYGWPMAWWQAGPALVTALWPTRRLSKGA